jgi:cohesin loading factor subunit SCC2
LPTHTPYFSLIPNHARPARAPASFPECRLPLARAAKAEAATDLRAWVEALVDDLLAAVPLPEWPAASVLLRRLVLAIQGERGLKSADATARLVCVDLLGQLSQRLCAMAKEADAPEATRAVVALLGAAKGGCRLR